MGAKHHILLGNTKVGRAVLEILEDRLDDVIRHYQDAQASGAASTITVKLKITPDEARQQFGFGVSGTTTLSARKSFETSIFAGFSGDGRVEIAEFNPRQLGLFQPTQPAGELTADEEE